MAGRPPLININPNPTPGGEAHYVQSSNSVPFAVRVDVSSGEYSRSRPLLGLHPWAPQPYMRAYQPRFAHGVTGYANQAEMTPQRQPRYGADNLSLQSLETQIQQDYGNVSSSPTPQMKLAMANMSFQDHPESGTNIDRYPNPDLTVAQESCLPSHPLFRPDMEVPRVIMSSRDYDLPRQKIKQKNTMLQVKERINAKTEEIILDLSSKGKFLPYDIVRRIVQELIEKERRLTGINVYWKDIAVLSHFWKLHGRIEELIKVYCMFTPITSLHELGIALAHSEKLGNYEDLHLGPLVAHPKVKDYFKPPDDIDSPPEISVYQLHNFFTKMAQSRRGNKFYIEDYLEFVRRKLGVESAGYLCIRITSFPLLLQVRCFCCYCQVVVVAVVVLLPVVTATY